MEPVTRVGDILIPFFFFKQWLDNLWCCKACCSVEWVFIALSNEIMWTAYLGIFVRARIMGLLKLYNCILLFLSFTSPFLMWLIPIHPQRKVLFISILLLYSQIWSPFIMQINLISAKTWSKWGRLRERKMN